LPSTSPNSSRLVKDVMLAFVKALGAALVIIVRLRAGLLAATENVNIVRVKAILGQRALVG
jgi:hypothetical protein